jgi:hypothetical protein
MEKQNMYIPNAAGTAVFLHAFSLYTSIYGWVNILQWAGFGFHQN